MIEARLQGAFELISPASGDTVPVYSNPEPAKSTIAVKGTFDTANTKVWIKIYPQGDPVPAQFDNEASALAAGCIRANLAGNVFSHKAVPGANLSTFAVAAFQGPDAGPFVSGAISDNVSALSSNKLVIKAQQSIWFTFAGDNYPGYPNASPQPESGELYRPQIVYVPNGMTQVTVDAVGTWGHCPTCLSGPNGNGTQRLLERDWYRLNNNADNITQVQQTDSQLNSLVGMWLTDGSTAAQEFKFFPGTPVGFPNGQQPTKLVLAFHDGFEWSNNVGAVEATLTWA